MRKTILANTRRNRRKMSRSEKSNKRNAKYFVLTVIIHKVKGTLGMPTTIAGRKERAIDIKTKCTSNSNVTIDATVITAVGGAITTYSSALPSDRAEAYRALTNMMENDLLAPFQKAADANPGMAVTILQSGGFHVTLPPVRPGQVFEAKNGTESGSIVLSAPGGPKNKRHLHDWMYSSDRINFVRLRSTNNDTTIMTGGIPGHLAYFTHELSIQDVPQGVSQIIEIMVK